MSRRAESKYYREVKSTLLQPVAQPRQLLRYFVQPEIESRNCTRYVIKNALDFFEMTGGSRVKYIPHKYKNLFMKFPVLNLRLFFLFLSYYTLRHQVLVYVLLHVSMKYQCKLHKYGDKTEICRSNRNNTENVELCICYQSFNIILRTL